MKYINIVGFVLLSVLLASCGNETPKTTTENSTPILEEKVQSIEVEGEETNEVPVVENEEVADISKTSYEVQTVGGEIVKIYPIAHATAVVQWGDTTIYVDPAEPTDSYTGLEKPEIILITHVHGDHLKQDVLQELHEEGILVIVPESVNKELSEQMQQYTTIMGKEVSENIGDFVITTVPAYNIREEALNFHPEERNDNGYIIEKDGLRVYFSGDSEDTPEMRALENIDVAFVSMNLPYTMTAESAASAVIEFAPKKVFPYHYRGKPEITDTQVFKSLVNESNPDIEVVLHDWYGE